MELGYQYERVFRRGRRVSIGFGAGATYLTTTTQPPSTPVSYAMPSGYGRAQFDAGASWSVRGDYRRAVSVLEGLTVEPFLTDAAMIGVGGFLGSRTELVLSAAYSSGAAAADFSGDFDSYSASVQLRFMLTRSWSALVSHNFYAYRLQGVTNLPKGFPSELNRNAIRVGMIFSLPLYGAYTTRRPQPGTGL
jgi:hypothetical protein